MTEREKLIESGAIVPDAGGLSVVRLPDDAPVFKMDDKARWLALERIKKPSSWFERDGGYDRDRRDDR